MSSASNASVCHGQTSTKPEHYYTSNPSSAHSTDPYHLQTYRLSKYQQDTHRPPMGSSQSTERIEAAHRKRVGKETDAILTRFYQQ
ncbi:hypothetical protein F4678DRAFT_69684 [Xylaria arbuscula]|nr:hypothetical protein F4678DRAFT_69684 [Xylaria arbuscula]